MAWILARRVGLTTIDAEPAWSALDAGGVVSVASRHRVIRLTLTAPEAARLPTAALRQLVARNRIQTLQAMSQAADLMVLLDAYTAAGIPLLLIKGQAFSSLVHGDWTARGVSADADFLIPPERIAEAHRVMLKLGYYCDHDEGHRAPLPGWRGRYNRWLHYERYYVAPGRLHVDVHWRPVPGSAPWTEFGALWDERMTVDLHGRTVQVPGPRSALRIAAGQGEPDGWPTLRSACDVVAAMSLVGSLELSELVASDRLVSVATRRAPEVLLHGNPDWWIPSWSPKAEHLRREWHLRKRTDVIPRALARSVLGMWIPARRLMPMDRLKVDHPQPLSR